MKISLRRILLGVLLGVMGILLLKMFSPHVHGGRNANQTAAVTTLRQYCFSAQKTYLKADYDNDGILEYAADLTLLYNWGGADDAQQLIRLVDLATAQAHFVPKEDLSGTQKGGYGGKFAAHSGYYYTELLGRETENGIEMLESPEGDRLPKGWKDGFGLIAIPAKLGRTGWYCFIINEEGAVYQAVIEDLDIDHLENLPRYWPDMDSKDSLWLMTSE